MFLFVRYRCYRRRGSAKRGEGTRRDVATRGAGLCAEKLNFFFLFVDFFVMLIAEEIRTRVSEFCGERIKERNGERSLRGEFVQVEGPYGLERSQFANSTVGQC